jgi:hypothetical protein
VLPVIEPGTSKVFFIDAKAQWTYQPEVGSGGQATAAHVPRVLGNLGLVEHNIKGGKFLHNR